MTLIKRSLRKVLLFEVIAGILCAPVVMAAENTDGPTLKQLQTQLNDVESQLQSLKNETASATEWQTPNTLAHVAGYASINYVDAQNSDGSYNVGNFSPIFHFQYRDLVMLESELEFSVKPDGETEVGIDYLTVDWFINDYMVLVAGQYLSPIGNFRQNIHPSWINKMASPPPGFGHGGAAPVSDMGLQLRGGFPTGSMRSTYAVYVSNGPELNSFTANGSDFVLEAVMAQGFGADRDGNKVYGGRYSLLPMNGLELGISGATGKASVTKLDTAGVVTELAAENARDYNVFGLDVSWHLKTLSVFAEYIKTDLGSAKSGQTASAGANWQTWYTQASYQFPSIKLEPVLRYTDFNSPEASKDQKQWMLGLNYLFTSNFIAKVGYEFNDGLSGTKADDDRVLLQFAYGF